MGDFSTTDDVNHRSFTAVINQYFGWLVL